MKERLKDLRKYLSLSQRAFCEAISMNQTTYASFETGKREIKDAYIKLICQTYNVGENWLRYGEGDMFQKEPSSSTKELLEIFDTLSPAFQEYLLKQVKDLLIIQETESIKKQAIKGFIFLIST